MALEVTGLKRSYGDFSVHLDFTVDSGETLSLVGPSGSGKTTALNLISGLSLPDSGRVLIGGKDLSGLPPWKRNISLVFQDNALFPHLDAGGNIAYGLFIRGIPRRERRKIMEEALKIVRLPSYASRRIHTLSGGERQRVAIARALASSPDALLLDEPFSALDAPLRSEMRDEFLEIRSRSDSFGSVPCVFVTHDREEAVLLGDRIALMAGGRIIESGGGRDLFLKPKTEFAARFFGAGQVLPCRMGEKRQNSVEVSSPLGALTVLLDPGRDYPCSLLFIPHDAFSFHKPESSGWKSFSAKCCSSAFEGQSARIRIILPDSETRLELKTGPRFKAPAPGTDFSVWVDQSLIRFVNGE
jgi:ABC-type Fe3+/spermidine/putrescine transport system ATPase subunit